jgi:RNA polymerase sigma factor (sigma-70 family)
MTEVPDAELLRRYARENSGEVFAVIVERHISLVHSVALRHTRDQQHAEDITQAVFILLARKASALGPKTVLSGWLYHAARLTAANFRRSEIRRTHREQEAYMQSTLQETAPNPLWPELAPMLDDAMSRLGAHDRDALVLRYFQNKSLAEVGAAMGMEQRAAQKRVLRALEKLRKFFSKHGVDSTAESIAVAISTHSVQAAPAALAKSVATVAVYKGATATTSTVALIKGALKIMAWSKTQTAVLTAVIIVCVVGGSAGYYAYRSAHLKPVAELPAPAAELQMALHIERPATGTWVYPSDKVELAMFHFGSNRANAFPILEKALKDSNPETRKQAVSAMEFVGMPARPENELLGDPSPDVVPLLWNILNSNDGELSSMALTSLRGIGFQPKDIPVLAALLVRSHGNQLSQKAMARPSVAQMQKFLSRANNDQMLQRYIPEAIATTIRQHPEGAAPFVSSVDDLLDDANADVRFGAACALAEYKGVNDSKISTELAIGLKIRDDSFNPYSADENLEQLMAIETLKRVGPGAKSMIPVLLNYANSTKDKTLRELAFSVAGQIDSNLRNTMPEVDQTMKNDLTLKNTVPPQ